METEIVKVEPLDIELIKFDYTKEQILTLVDEAKAIDLTDLEAVKEGHKVMVKIRTTLTEQGLQHRRNIKVLSDQVSEKEKGYLALSMDIEIALKKVLDDDKQAKLLEARKELLPMKRDQLNLLTHCREVTDDEILAMDDKQWVTFYQDQMAFNSREIQAAKDKEEADANAETNRLAAIEEGKKQGEADALALVEKEKKEAKEKEDKRIADEAKAQEELEANQKYQAFLDKNDYDSKTDIIERDGQEVRIYRLVARTKIK